MENLHWDGKIWRNQYVYVFVMVKCCATETSIILEGHQAFRWDVLAPLLQISSFQGIQIPLWLSGRLRTPVLDAPEAVVPGMHETHYKYGPLIPH